MYWFLSGFTAKLAGAEIGVKEPQPTFSACFGAPFLPQHPVIYARLLAKRLDEHGATGLARQHRLDRRHVRRRRADADLSPPGRSCARRSPAISTGSSAGQPSCSGSRFRSRFPTSTRSCSTRAPRWSDAEAYDAQAQKLAAMFRENFTKFRADDNIVAGGPRALR